MRGGKWTNYIKRRFEVCSSHRGLGYSSFSHGVANDQIFQEVSLNCLTMKKKELPYFETSASIQHSKLRIVPGDWNLSLGMLRTLIQSFRTDIQLGRKAKSAHDAQLEEKTHDGRMLVESRKQCLKCNRKVSLSVQNHFMSWRHEEIDELL
jgi:hypothetical protein